MLSTSELPFVLSCFRSAEPHLTIWRKTAERLLLLLPQPLQQPLPQPSMPLQKPPLTTLTLLALTSQQGLHQPRQLCAPQWASKR